MGEGTVRIAVKPPRQIEREIGMLRTRLDRSLAELDRRRHELANVRVQLRRHPVVLAGAGGLVLLLVGGVAFTVWRAHEREQPDDPEKVARPVWEKLLAAVGITIAVSLTRKLLDRLIRA